MKELLPRSSPLGAYALGVVCAIAWAARVDPSRDLLVMAMQAADLDTIHKLRSKVEAMLALRASLEAVNG